MKSFAIQLPFQGYQKCILGMLRIFGVDHRSPSSQAVSGCYDHCVICWHKHAQWHSVPHPFSMRPRPAVGDLNRSRLLVAAVHATPQLPTVSFSDLNSHEHSKLQMSSSVMLCYVRHPPPLHNPASFNRSAGFGVNIAKLKHLLGLGVQL